MGGKELLLPLAEVQKCVEDTQRDPLLLKNMDALLTRVSAVATFEVVEEYLGKTRNKRLRPNDKEVYEKSPIAKLGKELRDILSHSASSTQYPVKGDHNFDWLTLTMGDRIEALEAGSLLSYLTELHNFCEKSFIDAE